MLKPTKVKTFHCPFSFKLPFKKKLICFFNCIDPLSYIFMASKKQHTCHLCFHPFSSKQMLVKHMKGNVCGKKLTNLKLNNGVSPPKTDKPTVPGVSLGMDLDDPTYYLDICDQEGIKVGLSRCRKISIDDMMYLFTEINQLDHPERVHPIHSLVTKQPLSKVYMKKHDVYKYYAGNGVVCSHGELLQNDERFDLIRWVFDQLILIYQAVTQNEYLWITSQIQVEANHTRMKDQSRQTIRKWHSSYKTRSLLEEKLDKHYGAGYYQNIITKYKLTEKTQKIPDEKDCHAMDKQHFIALSELDRDKMDALSDAFAVMVFGDGYQSSGLKATDDVDGMLNDVDDARKAVIKFSENELSYERFKALFIEASAVPNISFLSQKEIDLVMLQAKEEEEEKATEEKQEEPKEVDSFVTPLKIPLALKRSESKT
jgi:hypothetical protein